MSVHETQSDTSGGAQNSTVCLASEFGAGHVRCIIGTHGYIGLAPGCWTTNDQRGSSNSLASDRVPDACCASSFRTGNASKVSNRLQYSRQRSSCRDVAFDWLAERLVSVAFELYLQRHVESRYAQRKQLENTLG